MFPVEITVDPKTISKQSTLGVECRSVDDNDHFIGGLLCFVLLRLLYVFKKDCFQNCACFCEFYLRVDDNAITKCKCNYVGFNTRRRM